MDVRAGVAFEAGKPLSIETVSLDGPKESECLVEIKATGICHTDEFTRSGEDPEGLFPADLPPRTIPLFKLDSMSREGLIWS